MVRGPRASCWSAKAWGRGPQLAITLFAGGRTQHRRVERCEPSSDHSAEWLGELLHARARRGARPNPMKLAPVLLPSTACSIVAQLSALCCQRCSPCFNGRECSTLVTRLPHNDVNTSVTSVTARGSKRQFAKASARDPELTPIPPPEQHRHNRFRGRLVVLPSQLGQVAHDRGDKRRFRRRSASPSQMPSVCQRRAAQKPVRQDRARL